MPKRLKFHAIAIAIISLVVMVVYTLFAPKVEDQAASNIATSGNYVRIVSATWGKNCDIAIDEQLKRRASEPASKDADGRLIPQPMLYKSFTDNALPALQEGCDHKIKCDFPVTDDTVGIKPSVDCHGQLEVSYRCFDVDRLRSKTVDNGNGLAIDCSADALAAPQAKP